MTNTASSSATLPSLPPGLTVRPAAVADFEAAERLFRALLGEQFVLDADLFASVCDDQGHLALIAEVENEGVVGIVVGTANERIRLAQGKRRFRLHIDQVIVSPAHRQRGIGRALLEAVITHVGERAPSYIIVTCDFTNVAARKTYESAGFVLVPTGTDRFEMAFDEPPCP
jgi:ribosomal protein S18 acetylase RimI-like enzyme